MLFEVTLFTPAYAKQIQNSKQEKRRQRERGIGAKGDDQQNSRRQLDIGQLPAPAMSMEPPRKGQPRDGRDHRKDVSDSSREASCSGIGIIQRRIVNEV